MVDIRLGRAVINWFADTSQFIQGVRRSGAALQRQVRDVNNVRRAYRGLSAQARALRSAFLGLSSVVAVGQAVNTIAQFEQALSTAIAISGAAEHQFAALREESTRLGATTRFSARQAAEGMVFIARAGFNVSEVLSTTEDTLLLAQAGALELGRAADIATNILTGFRLETSEAARVVDVLALAANSSNTNVDQLGEAMKFVAPVAAGLAVPLEVATAAVGALSNAGLQASVAGTGLRRVLAALEAPTVEAEKILRSLGLTAEEVRISQHGLIEVLRLLRDAGLDTGQALKFFGDRGGPAFEVLATSLDDVVRMTEALENAGGTARRIATIMDDNLNGAILRVRSAFEAVILAFGASSEFGALRVGLEALAESFRAIARNIDLAITVATTLIILLSGASLSAARGLIIVAQRVGLLSTSLGVAALAAKGLALALGIGFAVELFRQLTDEVLRYRRVVETIPESPDAATQLGGAGGIAADRFINAFIGTFVGLGNALDNAVALFVEPVSEALVAPGRESARAFWRGFNNAFDRLGEEFNRDLRAQYFEIADPTRIESLYGPPTEDAFRRLFSQFIDTSNISVAADDLQALQQTVSEIAQLQRQGAVDIIDADTIQRATRFRGLLDEFARSLPLELRQQLNLSLFNFFGLGADALKDFEESTEDASDKQDDLNNAIKRTTLGIRELLDAINEASFETLDFLGGLIRSQESAVRDIQQNIAIASTGIGALSSAQASGLRVRFGIENELEDQISQIEADLRQASERLTLARAQEATVTGEQAEAVADLILELRDEQVSLSTQSRIYKELRPLIADTAQGYGEQTAALTRTLNALTEGNTLLERSRTPQERYNEALAEQTRLYEMGLRSADEYRAIVKALTDDLQDQTVNLARAQEEGRAAFASFVNDGIEARRQLEREFSQELQLTLAAPGTAPGLEAGFAILNPLQDRIRDTRRELNEIQRQLDSAGIVGLSQQQINNLTEQQAALETLQNSLLNSVSAYEQQAEAIRENANDQALILEAGRAYQEHLEDTLTPAERYAQALEAIERAAANATTAQQQLNIQLARQGALLQYQQQQSDLINKAYDELTRTVRQAGRAIGGSFGEALEKASEFLDLLSQIGDLIQSLANLFGSLGGVQAGGSGGISALFGLFRAEGGPVEAGQPYIVGERGPEVVVPRHAGTVIPNHDMDRYLQQTIRLKTRLLTDQTASLHQTLDNLAKGAEMAAQRISRSFSEAATQVKDTVSNIERLATMGRFTEVPHIQEQLHSIEPVIQTLKRLQFRQFGGPLVEMKIARPC